MRVTRTESTRPARPSFLRRWTRRLGYGLILTGLAILAWIAWQLWGTNWQSERLHREIVAQLEEDWSGPGVAIVRIPKFGEDYAVPVLEGTTPEVLAAGFGHFEETAGPGEVGNYAIAGHRITHGEPLRRMPELVAGDHVIIETRHQIHTYVLDTGGADLRVDFTQVWVLDEVPTNPRAGGVQPPSQEPGQRLITLTTCAELFHTKDRLIAFGHLVETVDK